MSRRVLFLSFIKRKPKKSQNYIRNSKYLSLNSIREIQALSNGPPSFSIRGHVLQII